MAQTEKKIAKIDSLLLADYILYKGGAMSHLKLQKVLYYIQAYHLAYFDTPLIDDDFQAWVHGPVSRKLYNGVKDLSVLYNEIEYFHNQSEEHIKDIILQLTADQRDLIDEIIGEFGTLSGPQLENLTHSETPWINARAGYGPGEKCDNIIPKNVMRDFYRSELYGEAKN